LIRFRQRTVAQFSSTGAPGQAGISCPSASDLAIVMIRASVGSEQDDHADCAHLRGKAAQKV
jgi:hypothetical protein